jgi:23S rRNA pseudouridine1911/1915/1917 synthase
MSDDELDDDIAPEPAALTPSIRLRQPLDLVVMVKSEGMRLDQYVHLHLGADWSRSEVQRAIESGGVTVNGKPASKPSYKVRKNDRLHVEMPEPTHDIPVPEDIPLDILYQDDWLAVVNKPHDMVVHPAKGNWSGTLVNALQWHFRDHLSTENGQLRAGIVHRLDKDTSGLIVIAKHDRARRNLAEQFQSRSVDKVYTALLEKRPQTLTGRVEAPIGRDPKQRKRMAVLREGRPAITEFTVIDDQFEGGYALVKVHLLTGRTHQIRVHMAFIGCPIVGDSVYGIRKQRVGLKRQFLHASELSFDHPTSGERLHFESPLPPGLQNLLSKLRQGQ